MTEEKLSLKIVVYSLDVCICVCVCVCVCVCDVYGTCPLLLMLAVSGIDDVRVVDLSSLQTELQNCLPFLNST